jgi:lipoate-protein ligase B
VNEASASGARALSISALGSTPYREGLELQEALVSARADRETGDWLLFPDHPPVLTVGRGGSIESLRVSRGELARRGIEIFEVRRGGDFTWHGPGQLVGYTILDLEIVERDVHRLLRGIEEALIRAVGRFGIEAQRSPGRTGIWVGESKLASIGIAVRRWVSYHGFALNVDPDLGSFDLIHPCGLRDVRVTSMRELMGSPPAIARVREVAAEEVAACFGYGGVIRIEANVVRAAAHAARVARVSGEELRAAS